MCSIYASAIYYSGGNCKEILMIYSGQADKVEALGCYPRGLGSIPGAGANS